MSAQIIEKLHKQGELFAKGEMRFVKDSVLQKLQMSTPEEMDLLDFGVICLDDKGIIKIFNQYEADRANLNSKSVLGKNFFTEIAPCTNNQIFFGSFKKGVEERKMDLIFPYTFTYKMKPSAVKIHLYRGPARPINWIFIKWN